MSKDKNPETEETEGKGGKKKLLLIVGVLLLAAAGAAYFFLFAGSGEAEAAAPEHGGYVALEPIAVNLAGGGHGGASVDGAKAYDQIISTFSQAQPADVTGARDALKEALEEKIIEAYHGEVMGIYYTEYVTQ